MEKKSMKMLAVLLVAAATISSATAQVKSVLARVSSNDELYTAGFTDISMKMVNLTSDKFSIKGELEKIKSYFYLELLKELPFEVIPEKAVLENQAFQNYVVENNSKIIAMVNSSLAYDGYLKYLPLTKDGKAELLELFAADGVNTLLSLDVTCYIEGKTMVANTGTAVATIKVIITLFDRGNNLLMSLEAKGQSKQTLKVVGGQITSGKDNIPEYLQEASVALFEDMTSKLPKAIKKFEKKLAKFKG
jgi:hypothetical protein